MFESATKKIARGCGALAFAALLLAAAIPTPARAEGAVKHYILIDLKPEADQLALDRWYLAHHGPENRRAVKAWQRNYLSYRSYLPSEKALAAYPLQYGRLTEIHFDSVTDFREARANSLYGELTSYTPPPGGWRENALFITTTITIPVNPDELLMSSPTPPKETPYLRWMIVFDYPASVNAKTGDDWWMQTRAEELKNAPGLRRFAFYRSVSDVTPNRRAAELWFDDLSAWETAFTQSGRRLTPAPWGEPFDAAAMMFVGENPDIDFIHDKRVIP